MLSTAAETTIADLHRPSDRSAPASNTVKGQKDQEQVAAGKG